MRRMISMRDGKRACEATRLRISGIRLICAPSRPEEQTSGRSFEIFPLLLYEYEVWLTWEVGI